MRFSSTLRKAYLNPGLPPRLRLFLVRDWPVLGIELLCPAAVVEDGAVAVAEDGCGAVNFIFPDGFIFFKVFQNHADVLEIN